MKQLIIVLCLCFSHSLYAAECSGNAPNLSIYFGNGMFNNLDDSNSSRLMIKYLTERQLPEYRLSYKVAINHNENPFDQLLEVSRQKALQDYGVILLWLAGIEAAPDWFREALSEVAILYQSFSYILDRDLQTHVSQYIQDIERCRKVLLVAHSQGNFYGNEAWQRVYKNSINSLPLNQLKVMGMVSVATPASFVGAPLDYEGDQQKITRYLTLNDDLVINVIRSAIIDPLPGNLANSNESSDWKNHSFVDTYASGNPSQQVLTNFIRSVAFNLESLPLNRTTLDSSALASAGYDHVIGMLEIEFTRSGSVYRYYDVPETVYNNLISAASAGGYYNQAIRGQYPSRRLF